MDDTLAENVLSRFEEGKPADPTENMSPEDAKRWREEHDKNQDRFKEAAEPPIDMRVALRFEATRNKSAPSQVDKYYKQVKKDNPSYGDDQAWATAWSIYCAYKNPGSPSCHQDSYFGGKQAADPDWKGVAKKLLEARKGNDQDDLHYRAYMRAVIAGTPTKHLVEKHKGAKQAQSDLIDEAGKAPKTAAGDDKAKVRTWMRNNVRDYVDNRTNEVNSTELAEAAADHFGHKDVGDWLDDETHWVWDLAADAAEQYERAHKHAAKTAGFSYASAPMSVLFVEGRRPVPFNIDTIQDINHTTIEIIGDDGEKHDVNLHFLRQQSSGPLTQPQEKLGWRRETRVDIEHPVDEGASPASSARAAMAALVQLGRKHGFKVEPVKAGYQPQTRKP